jgi:tRNA A37 threonylcarbamoyladenosine modification protein TsaB
MRLVLALEASSMICAVAVGAAERPGVQRASYRDDPAYTLFGALAAETLTAAEATFGDIGTIAVDVGPGGLSPIRAAVAYANGLAFGLGVKIFPISSLELMAIEARQAHRGPILSLKRSPGGNIFAALFIDGEIVDMRHGLPGSVVPAIAAGLKTVSVAGPPREDVADLLPGVTVVDTGIADADVTVLYQAARAGLADPNRVVPAATALNEASPIFHEPAASCHPIGNEVRELRYSPTPWGMCPFARINAGPR